MRNRRDIADCRHANTGIINGADGRFATAARPLDAHFALLHARFRGPLSRLIGRLLRSERRALAIEIIVLLNDAAI